MAEDKREVVRVSSETAAHIKAYAEKLAITGGEAADKLVGTGVSRLAALSRYATNTGKQPPGKPREKTKAKPGPKPKPRKPKAKDLAVAQPKAKKPKPRGLAGIAVTDGAPPETEAQSA